MELRSGRRGVLLPKVALLCCICVCFGFSAFALVARTGSCAFRTCLDRRSSRADSELEETRHQVGWAQARRNLGGLGSHPPRCDAKCGRCTPCRPVHVTVPPGTPVITEYYPEAWRCKCGNRFYMP